MYWHIYCRITLLLPSVLTFCNDNCGRVQLIRRHREAANEAGCPNPHNSGHLIDLYVVMFGCLPPNGLRYTVGDGPLVTALRQTFPRKPEPYLRDLSPLVLSMPSVDGSDIGWPEVCRFCYCRYVTSS